MDNKNIFLKKYHVIICAVLFGCDDSIIGLDLGNELVVTRKSLHPKDYLEKIFEIDSMELRREYENARLDMKKLDVACIFKEYDYDVSDNSLHSYYDHICSELFTYLDNQIRAVRLLLEGPVRYKKLVVKMYSSPIEINQCDIPYGFCAIMPVGEAYNVKTIQKAHCDNIGLLRAEMDKITFPITLKYLNQCHLLYDRSYLVTLQEAEVLLITSLEILFLKSENSKKERLSKRCAAFIFESKEERLECYKKLIIEYKKRSDFVHDGNSDEIIEEDILFLRECVRSSLVKLMYVKEEKDDLIHDLKQKINSLEYW